MAGNTAFDISQYDVFTKEEHAFLAGIFAHHPAIATNFERYLNRLCRSTSCHGDSGFRRNTTHRMDEKKCTKPGECEVTYRLCRKICFAEAPVGVDAYRAQAMASIHDIPEAIVTDFIPTDPISKEDKAAL